MWYWAWFRTTCMAAYLVLQRPYFTNGSLLQTTQNPTLMVERYWNEF